MLTGLFIKEMIVDFRKQQREQPPYPHRQDSSIHIDGTVVEKVEHFKFLGVHITDKLKWSTHTDSVVKKALKKFGILRASCRAVSPPGIVTSPPTTVRLSRG